MNTSAITPGTLMMHTRTEDVYKTLRVVDEQGSTLSITSKLVGKKEVSTLYTVDSVRRVKAGLSIRVTDMEGRVARVRYTEENAAKWSICEPIPA